MRRGQIHALEHVSWYLRKTRLEAVMGNGETREQATAESRWGTMATGLRQGFRCGGTGDSGLLCLCMHILAGSM